MRSTFRKGYALQRATLLLERLRPHKAICWSHLNGKSIATPTYLMISTYSKESHVSPRKEILNGVWDELVKNSMIFVENDPEVIIFYFCAINWRSCRKPHVQQLFHLSIVFFARFTTNLILTFCFFQIWVVMQQRPCDFGAQSTVQCVRLRCWPRLWQIRCTCFRLQQLGSNHGYVSSISKILCVFPMCGSRQFSAYLVVS